MNKRVYISASFALSLALDYDFWCSDVCNQDWYIDDTNGIIVMYLVIGKDYAYIITG